MGSTSPMMSAMVTSGVASSWPSRAPGHRSPSCGATPGALLGQELAPELRDRRERVVVHFAPRENRNLFVEQRDELAQDAALRLPAQAQQDEVVARQYGVHELRNDGLLVAHDTREQRRAVLEQADQILAQLVFDGAVDPGGTRPLGLLQLAQRGRLGHRAIVNRPPPAM